jgi:hypothetical protein
MSKLLELNFDVEWRLGLGNSPVLIADAISFDVDDSAWDFVEDSGSIYVKRQVHDHEGIWEYCSLRVPVKGVGRPIFKGGAGMYSSYLLTDGRIIETEDVWSSSAESISEIFDLVGDDCLSSVDFYGRMLAISRKDYKSIVLSLGYCVYERRPGCLCPSMSETAMMKEGVVYIEDAHVESFIKAMSLRDRKAWIKRHIFESEAYIADSKDGDIDLVSDCTVGSFRHRKPCDGPVKDSKCEDNGELRGFLIENMGMSKEEVEAMSYEEVGSIYFNEVIGEEDHGLTEADSAALVRDMRDDLITLVGIPEDAVGEMTDDKVIAMHNDIGKS